MSLSEQQKAQQDQRPNRRRERTERLGNVEQRERGEWLVNDIDEPVEHVRFPRFGGRPDVVVTEGWPLNLNYN